MLCFTLAAIVAYFGLNSQYTNTNFLLRRYFPYYSYSLFWGVLAVAIYWGINLTNLHITIGQTNIDDLNYNYYVKAFLVGCFTKSVFDGFNFTYSIGPEDKTIGLKTITDIVESNIMTAVDNEHSNSLKEFVKLRQKGYTVLEDVLEEMRNDLPRSKGTQKYFSITYILDLDDEVLDPDDSDETNIRRVMENFLITFGKRTFDRVFPEISIEDHKDKPL